jgi:hypothetical protein
MDRLDYHLDAAREMPDVVTDRASRTIQYEHDTRRPEG